MKRFIALWALFTLTQVEAATYSCVTKDTKASFTVTGNSIQGSLTTNIGTRVVEHVNFSGYELPSGMSRVPSSLLGTKYTLVDSMGSAMSLKLTILRANQVTILSQGQMYSFNHCPQVIEDIDLPGPPHPDCRRCGADSFL